VSSLPPRGTAVQIGIGVAASSLCQGRFSTPCRGAKCECRHFKGNSPVERALTKCWRVRGPAEVPRSWKHEGNASWPPAPHASNLTGLSLWIRAKASLLVPPDAAPRRPCRAADMSWLPSHRPPSVIRCNRIFRRSSHRNGTACHTRRPYPATPSGRTPLLKRAAARS